MREQMMFLRVVYGLLRCHPCRVSPSDYGCRSTHNPKVGGSNPPPATAATRLKRCGRFTFQSHEICRKIPFFTTWAQNRASHVPVGNLRPQRFLDGRKQAAEFLRHRLVVITFGMRVDVKRDLLAIHMPEPILTNLQGSAFCIHQRCIPVTEGMKANPHNALLDAKLFQQGLQVVLHDLITDPWSSIPGPKDERFRIAHHGSDLRTSLNLTSETGLLVVHVEASGPAEQAGLMVGDILLGFGGAAPEELLEFRQHLHSKRIGDKVDVSIVRGGVRNNVVVSVGERPVG